MMKNILGIIVVFGTLFSAKAQQLPESNLYMLNRYAINPAYAGFENKLEGYVSNLSQWAGFSGAPRTSYFMVHSDLPSLNENMSVGGQVVMDRTSMINRLSAVVSYGYKLDLGNEQYLRFGLSGGMYQVNANPSNATVLDNNDNIVLGGANKGITFSSEFGALYSFKGVQFGVSVPEVFQRKVDFNIQGLSSEYYLKRNLQVYGSYLYEASDMIKVEPSVFMKTIGNGIYQFDFNVLGTYNDMISLGLGYRTQSGLLSQLHIQLKDIFYIGYAYSVPGSGLIKYSSGSHEIMIGTRLTKSKIKGGASFE